LGVRGRSGSVRSEGWLAELCESYVCTCIHIHIDTNINTNTRGFVANPVAAVQKDSVQSCVVAMYTHTNRYTYRYTYKYTHTGVCGRSGGGREERWLAGFCEGEQPRHRQCSVQTSCGHTHLRWRDCRRCVCSVSVPLPVLSSIYSR